MTQSFTLREPTSELASEARFTSLTMMPPWEQSEVAFNLDMNLAKSGQKRRRSFMPITEQQQQQQQDQFHMYSNENMMLNERGSNDSVQLSNPEPYPGGGTHIFNSLDSSAFPSERRGFYSRMVESSSCGVFPFRGGPELVEHNTNPSATVFSSRHNAHFSGERPPESAAAATAQAIASFQAIIDQERSLSSSAAAGLQAYHHGTNGTQTPSFHVSHRQTPSLAPRQAHTPQEFHANHGFSSLSSFGLRTNSSPEFGYCQATQQDSHLDPAATDVHGSATRIYEVNGAHQTHGVHEVHGEHGAYGANVEHTWPSLACNTSARSASEMTLFPDSSSPCTPRGHCSVDTVFLSEAQEEYLQHSERLNSGALLSADTPHRGRRLSYNSSPTRENNDYSIFHPLELHHHPLELNHHPLELHHHPLELHHHHPDSQEQHLHVYFDEFGIPEHTEVEEAAPAAISGAFTTQEESFSLNFEPTPAAIAAAAVIAGEKEITRKNAAAADTFDLNEVPVSVGEATTPPKPRKKYHPRVAKDKRMCKRRVDGKKVPSHPGDGVAKSDSFARKSAKKRAGQQTTTTTQCDAGHEEGRDSGYPEVVDMDIEDMTTTAVAAATTTQHDTATCDCEACIKLRLERRNSTGLNSRFTTADDLPQSPQSPAHSSDSLSNSPPARRTLFQAPSVPEFNQGSNEARAETLALAIPEQANAVGTTLPDSSPEEAHVEMMMLSQANATAYDNVRSYFNSTRARSCLQQFEESVMQLGWDKSQPQEEGATADSSAWNQPLSSTFMSRLCPRGILSPHNTPFRDMNHIQRVVYLKSILSSNPQLELSPESLLRHVLDHLPEDEKAEFESDLWPIVLKPLSEEETQQLKDYAISEQQQQQTPNQVQEAVPQGTEVVAVVKRKPGPKPKKKGLALTLWPNLVESSKGIADKAGKGRKSKKKNITAVEEDSQKNHGLEMVPYENVSSDKSVVVYENGKTVVVYEGPLIPLRKKKARAKVVLDGETVRVWKLLMGKPGSGGAEKVTEGENEVKWEEERRKMKAQALRFIERMHIVQGDRSFSCWKGSVVDSVVGAFLTQNVNDVLSSSAFMSMRSRFPCHGLPRSPLQTKNPDDADDAGDANADNPSSPAPQITESSTQNTAAPECSPNSVTVLESQESRNQESSYETAAPTSHTPWQNHEESAASTISEVINPPDDTSSGLGSGLFASTMPELISPAKESLLQAPLQDQQQALPQARLLQALPDETSSGLFASTIPELISPVKESLPQALPQELLPQALPPQAPPQAQPLQARSQAPPQPQALPLSQALPLPQALSLPQARPQALLLQGEQSNQAQSENSSGLEYQMVSAEGSTSQVDMVVSSETAIAIAREFSTEGGALVEAYHPEPSHGKYNPKTGLTGLERAKIEEKQVTARKSFDFSTLNAQFKPRMAGETRPAAAARTAMTEDGVDWEAVRAADVQAVADVIKERGLNWILAGRIKAFLERLHLDYGALDLEWLRSMSTDQTKDFLLSIRGLGLKSVECIRLLTLHHLAFPVDTNVGRICVRLGWVPLEPLPEELQLHLLELYPVQATIQKYLWPRLCKLDQQTLYELHYQMITFGKVFCTKSKPNCNACPMRPECKHFASALSSAKLALPASERPTNGPTLALPPGTEQDPPQDRGPEPPRLVSQYCCQPIVEEPMTPESEADLEVFDIEDYPFTVEEVEDDMDMSICFPDPQASTQLVQQSKSINNPNCCSILSITDTYTTILEPEPVPEPVSGPLPDPLPGLLSEPLTEQIQTIMEDWGGLAKSKCRSVQLGVNCEETQSSLTSVIEIVESVCEEVLDLESNVKTSNTNSPSEVLIHTTELHEMVLVPPGIASLPVPKLKNVGRLRTVHYVYELPDSHPLLDGLDPKEHDDPCTYLLAIWSPGEVPQSMPNMNDTIDEENPFATSNSEGEESIKATLLVPCRIAMRGSFPLNGTYFQVNEVFADHASSLQPILVSRTLLWNLRRRFVYFGTSVTSIFRGMTVEEIQACFWRGYVCVRGFDRATRAPKPLVGRLHLQAGKVSGRGANAES